MLIPLATTVVDWPPTDFISASPGLPTPQFFWAVLTWVLIPGMMMVWMAYHHRKERTRDIRRKLRQLELRLALAVPTAASAQSPQMVPLRHSPAVRPSSLTARILLPASGVTSPIPVFRQPLPGQSG